MYSARLDFLIAVVMKGFVFWNITPYSPLKINRSFGGTCRLHEAVDFQRTTRQYIPEDGTLEKRSFVLRFLSSDGVDYENAYPPGCVAM